MGAKPRSAPRSGQTLDRAQLIEQFRTVGLRLDRAGRFWHRGTEITHPRLARALRRWLDVRAEDGRPIIRLDETRYAYVEVEDAFLLIESIHWDGATPIATLNDGNTEPLACDTLKIGPGFALYARARDRRLLARLTPRAYYSLAERIQDTPAGFALQAPGGPYPILDL